MAQPRIFSLRNVYEDGDRREWEMEIQVLWCSSSGCLDTKGRRRGSTGVLIGA